MIFHLFLRLWLFVFARSETGFGKGGLWINVKARSGFGSQPAGVYVGF
jgi:hypothetical protein